MRAIKGKYRKYALSIHIIVIVIAHAADRENEKNKIEQFE